VLTVIKLGGSLLNTKALPACLDAVERFSGQVLIVPGGGVFADQVRVAQLEWGFDDVTAHRMALLAMQQMACVFKSLKPDFDLFHCVSDRSALPKIAVWCPDPDELDAAGVAAGWEITSDSLAAWLAGQVNADRLLLVKSCQVDEAASVAELQQTGVIDAAFGRTIAQATFKINVISKDRFLLLHDQIYQIATE